MLATNKDFDTAAIYGTVIISYKRLNTFRILDLCLALVYVGSIVKQKAPRESATAEISLSDLDYLKPADVAASYPLSISWLFINRKKPNRIRFFKVGRRVLYLRKDIEDFLAAQAVA